MNPATNSASALIWVVTVPSSYRFGHQCFLGQGATRADAMADAYGPKPWPRASKSANCYQVTEEQAQDMRAQ